MLVEGAVSVAHRPSARGPGLSGRLGRLLCRRVGLALAVMSRRPWARRHVASALGLPLRRIARPWVCRRVASRRPWARRRVASRRLALADASEREASVSIRVKQLLVGSKC